MTTARGKYIELIASNSKSPGKTALQLYTGEVLTYGELIGLIDQTQSAIQRFSIKPYDRIALISSKFLVYPPMMLAIIENATCVPMDYDLSPEEYVKNYELLSVDYVMCGRAEGAALEAASNCGIGIIEFYEGEPAEPTSLQFNLLQRPVPNHIQNAAPLWGNSYCCAVGLTDI